MKHFINNLNKSTEEYEKPNSYEKTDKNDKIIIKGEMLNLEKSM